MFDKHAHAVKISNSLYDYKLIALLMVGKLESDLTHTFISSRGTDPLNIKYPVTFWRIFMSILLNWYMK